jgi:hypothetical protein
MTHRHGLGCGHTAIRHGDHVDYLNDNRLEHQQGDVVVAHRIEVSERNPDRCTPNHRCSEHAGHVHDREPAEHRHHPMVPHGDHEDQLHEGRLHRHHGDHCDDHGPVEVVLS